MNRRSLAIGGTAAVVAAAVGGGVAYAASGDSSQAAQAPGTATFATVKQAADSTNGSTNAKAKRAHRPLRRIMARRVTHGEFTVKTKDGFRTVQVQQGTVSAVSASSITLVSADHYSHTYTIGSHTRVRVDGARSTASKLVTGHHARVITAPRYGSNTVGVVIEGAK